MRHIAPFWAVMLAGRDSSNVANMRPHIEEYTLAQPVAKHYGKVPSQAKHHVTLPMLSNTRDLAPGELLVLPFDGGMDELYCEGFPEISKNDGDILQ